MLFYFLWYIPGLIAFHSFLANCCLLFKAWFKHYLCAFQIYFPEYFLFWAKLIYSSLCFISYLDFITECYRTRPWYIYPHFIFSVPKMVVCIIFKNKFCSFCRLTAEFHDYCLLTVWFVPAQLFVYCLQRHMISVW